MKTLAHGLYDTPQAGIPRLGWLPLMSLIAALGAADGAIPVGEHELQATPGRVIHRVVGITAPVRLATLGSAKPARIARIHAMEGSFVGKGDLLVSFEDERQRARTRIAKAAAESTLDVELARARWERAERDLERLTKLHGGDNASSKEVGDARADAQILRLQLDIAEADHRQAQREYKREQAVLNELCVRAPFSAYISKQSKQIGETVDQLEGVLTLVQLDPLHVTMDCPLALASVVHVGDRARVRPADPGWAPRPGTVILANRVADGASQTFKIKLSVGNRDASWMSGMKVTVEFLQAGEPASTSVGKPRVEPNHPEGTAGDKFVRSRSH